MVVKKVWTVRRIVRVNEGEGSSTSGNGWQAAVYRVVTRKDGMPAYRFDHGVGEVYLVGGANWDAFVSADHMHSAAHAQAKNEGELLSGDIPYVPDVKQHAMAVTLDWLLPRVFEPAEEAAYRLNAWPRLYLLYKNTSRNRFNVGVAMRDDIKSRDVAIFKLRLGNVSLNQLTQLKIELCPPLLETSWGKPFPLQSSAGKPLVEKERWQ